MYLINLRWIFVLTVGSISIVNCQEINDTTNTQSINKKVILEAEINQVFDNILPSIKQFLLNYGMNPLNITGFSEEVPVPGIIRGNIDLKNGWVYHLPNMRRAGSVVVTYADKKLTIKSMLGWRVVDFDYDYLFRYFLIKREGKIQGHFVNLKADVVIIFDMNKLEAILQSIKFNEVSIFYLNFGGHLSDKLINPISRVVTTVSKVKVLRHIEARSLYVFRKVFDELNARMKTSGFKQELSSTLPLIPKGDNNTSNLFDQITSDFLSF